MRPSARLFAVLLLCAAATSAWAQRRVALVIGNGAYRSVAGLANPASDAAAMAAMLRGAFDDVTVRTNVGFREMNEAVRDFALGAADADVAVVFYAGHGVEIGGRNFLVPIDAELKYAEDADAEAVELDRILRLLEPVRRLKLIILDACRDNPFAARMRSIGGARAVGRGLAAPKLDISDTLVAFATAPGATASDGDGAHSPFTTALLDNLMLPELDIRIALGKTRDAVLRATGNRQVPFISGSLGGDTLPLAASSTVVPGRIDAEQSAFATATARGDMAAFDAFIAKYPSGPYTQTARRERDRLRAAAELARRRAEPDVDAPADESRRYHYVADVMPPDDWLALRSAPSADEGMRLRKMPNGTLLEVLTERADGWWRVRVVDTGEIGWAKSGVRGKRQWIRCCKAF
jgi:uncharacterized caspase-like protein